MHYTNKDVPAPNGMLGLPVLKLALAENVYDNIPADVDFPSDCCITIEYIPIFNKRSQKTVNKKVCTGVFPNVKIV